MEQYGNRKRKLLGAQMEDALMDYIRNTPVTVGEKLPNEFELGQMFGVGRSTVREAVKSLATKGVLEVRRGDGTYVKSHHSRAEDPLGVSGREDTFQTALELFDVRLMLEPELAARAADMATPEDLERLVALCNETERLYRSGADHIPEDIEFHTCIARCSKNRVVETLIPTLNTAVATFGDMTCRKLMQETIDTHRAITDAIVDGDAVGARCAMVMHLTYNRQMLLRLQKEAEEQGGQKMETSDESVLPEPSAEDAAT